jgi:hypothetical protein
MEWLSSLVGVIVGAAITFLADYMRRRWDRADRQRENKIKWAEELTSFVDSLDTWQKQSLEAACDGHMPQTPTGIFRLQILVSAYLPTVEASAFALAAEISKVHSACVDVSLAKTKSVTESEFKSLLETTVGTMKRLAAASSQLTEAISGLLRESIR